MAALEHIDDTLRQQFLAFQESLLEHKDTTKKVFFGRLSGNEPLFCTGLLINHNELLNQLIRPMLYVAGIQFCAKEDFTHYLKYYLNSVRNSDYLGVWGGGGPMEQQGEFFLDFCDPHGTNFNRFRASVLDMGIYSCIPEYNISPFFENKKVLVITSHKETTIQQLPKYDKLFEKPIFHETTQFHVYKPPQQNAGNQDTHSWVWHFDKMKEELKTIKENEFDFDIALVSCGGFGMPISDYIHGVLDTSVIYVGGALQLWFGIKGKRWEENPKVKYSVNEHWVNVLDEDKPKQPELAEGGAYW